MSHPQPDPQEIREVAPDTFVDETGHQLTSKEVRQIVTPHAFAVADELIGQPLARPVRRGLAMGRWCDYQWACLSQSDFCATYYVVFMLEQIQSPKEKSFVADGTGHSGHAWDLKLGT